MQHDPPFRAEHIGSFLRPAALLEARHAYAAGKLDAAGLRAVENEAIRDIVALQEKIGLKVVTDGEYRRGTYTDNFTTEGLTGIRADWVGEGEWAYTDVSGHRAKGRIPTVYERIRRKDSTNAADFSFLKSLTGVTPKITLPGPCYLHFRAGRQHISRTAYPDLDGFWADIIAAYKAELAELYAAGCRYVQLDETSLAKFGDPKIRASLDARGDPWEKLLDLYVEVTNQVIAAASPGMRIGLHLCRGNNQGHWQAEGGYDVIAERLFRKLDAGFFFLEYDSPRAGSFEPLRKLPEDKTVVLGLVSTKTTEVEPAQLLIDRINEAARYAPLDQLALSPQCGFASSEKGNKLSVEQQSGKLRRVVEVAGGIWH